MNANVTPRDQEIILARSLASSRKEFKRILRMTTDSGAQKAMKRLGLPLYIPENPARQKKRSPETINDVIECYQKGVSFLQIAALHGLTKGAVAGILNRAGVLKTRAPAMPKPFKAKTNNTNRQIHPPKLNKVPFAERVSAAPFLGVSLMDRKFNQCANPDPRCDDPRDMTYCGQPTYGTLPYCFSCCQVLYRPAKSHSEPRPR